MPAGWAPYRYGRWVNHDPWGWVWVEEEPWGYAPFHYGRWVNYGGRWGWIPGPVNAHPVWSPALVAFAGGVKVGGFGLSVWFPLGPGEPYHPWYHSSQRYIDQINISNIRESQSVHVQKTYVNINVTNITYVNRTIGVSAMRENDFAAGRPVGKASVQIDAHVVDRPNVLESPQVQPNPRQMVSNRPARTVPVQAQRPTLINEKGMMVVAKPNAQPVAVPMKTAPVVKTLPGRRVVAPPPAITGAAGRTNGAQPASGGAATGPTNKSGALPARTLSPQTGTQPGARQQQGPNANPATGPPANPASGPTNGRANQPQSTPATGAGAQPANAPSTLSNQPGTRQPQQPNQPENGQAPQTTNQPGARQPQQPGANTAPQSVTRPSQGTEAKPNAAPAANSPAQPNAKASPQANKQGNQKQSDEKQKQDEKKKEEQEKQ